MFSTPRGSNRTGRSWPKSVCSALTATRGRSNLPGISTRILEPPTEGRRVDEDLSVIVALALKNLGVARRTEREAGSWTISGAPIASGDDWQEWPAKHKGTTSRPAPASSPAGRVPRRTRVRRAPQDAARVHAVVVAAARVHRRAPGSGAGRRRQHRPRLPGDPGYEPLDLALATRTLTAEQQLTVLTRVADALAYAHRNHVAHRGLGPSTVLVHTERLDAGRVDVRLVDWSWQDASTTAVPGRQRCSARR